MSDQRGIARTWAISIALVGVIVAASFAPTAATAGGNSAKATVVIASVTLNNLDNGAVRARISGGGFAKAGTPHVSLDDGTRLRVLEAGAKLIVADIPPGVPDGEYRLSVQTGDLRKQQDSAPITLGGTLVVSCIDWFRSGPADEHVHVEVHVTDENGDGVVGAVVTWTNENDTVGVYQSPVGTTTAPGADGHNEGAGCARGTASTAVTGWYCCIGAGAWDGTPKGSRSCNPGFYTSKVLSVTAPPSTNMAWDGATPANGTRL